MSEEKKKLQIGLVMPIAMIDNCGPEHWIDVKSIIVEALNDHEKYDFEARIVSESDSSGLIHKRIVHGLYHSDIVICDVSCKNPNVMFELGMRLAFDKPTIIIKDDKTNFVFDTSGIEHVEYPRDLRFTKMVEFKSTLLRKVVTTYEDSISDPNHSPFLGSFGEFKVAKLSETEVTPYQLLLDKVDDLQRDINTIRMKPIDQIIERYESDILTRARAIIRNVVVNNWSTTTGLPGQTMKLTREVNEQLSNHGIKNLSSEFISDCIKSQINAIRNNTSDNES
ncbi:hypothetical protein ACFPPD_06855 [Cohnella suwonensis]|uniref:RNA helicase n=1 Tax=Cohnella suwonensis TaxID=696072 RepID=A0ABW0LRD3_9BACL